jgi:hypothetical protein
MQFALIIYHGTSPLPGSEAWKALPATEHQAVYAEFVAINANPDITLRLPPLSPNKATTVQLRDGNVEVKDGPHLNEGIGGVFVLEAGDMDAAIELASRVPQARLGGAVEIRPIELYC